MFYRRDTNCLLQAVPRRYFFHVLSNFTTSYLEKEKLIEFSTPEGQEELNNYANHPRRTVLEVLQDFPQATTNIPLEYMFELFQLIRPRALSIASSPKVTALQLYCCLISASFVRLVQLMKLSCLHVRTQGGVSIMMCITYLVLHSHFFVMCDASFGIRC